MKAIHLLLLSVVIFIGSCSFTKHNPYTKKYPVTITVIGKMEQEHTYKSRVLTRPVVGVRADNGRLFDVELSVAQYSQWNIGDRFVLTRSDYELYFSPWKELLRIATGLTLIVSSMTTLVLIFFVEWGSLYANKREE